MNLVESELDMSVESADDVAADWVCRIDEGCESDDWDALDLWLVQSAKNRDAFRRISAAWRMADQLAEPALLRDARVSEKIETLRGLSSASNDESYYVESYGIRMLKALPALATGAFKQLRDFSRAEKPHSFISLFGLAAPRARSGNVALGGLASRWSLAAVLMTVLPVVLGLWLYLQPTSEFVYSTGTGQFYRAALEDGSVIELNTGSVARVRYTAGSRTVWLEKGEALFKVGKDAGRPFDVVANDTTVRAVGTAFTVRIHDDSPKQPIEVVISEGRVQIVGKGKVTYPAGTALTIQSDGVRERTIDLEQVQDRLAWTQGRLSFKGETLDAIVKEFNRYNPRKLRITDPAIAGIRLGGQFQATDPDGFVRALDRSFGIKSHVVSRRFGADVIQLDGDVQ
jgi:transmembrane sensor